MSLTLTEEDLELLGDADTAAAAARIEWLKKARGSRQGGKQLPPLDADWQIFLMIAGRGWGKSEAIHQFGWWEAWRVPEIVGHIVAPTLSDLRTVTFEGPVGLCALIPKECLKGGTIERAYNKTTHELFFSNGSIIRGFGAVEEGSRLRGPQCHFLMGDEIAQWDRPAGNLEQAMSNALFGLRLPYPDGTPSRAIMGTTPRPIAFLKRFEKRPGVRVVRGTSYENIDNLSATYRTQLLTMAGTMIGKQEIDALYIDEESDLSILKRSWIKMYPAYDAAGRLRKLPAFHFIVESYDTASSEHSYDAKKQTTDPSGAIVLGIFNVNDAFTEDERKRMGLRRKYAALLMDCWTERLGLPDLLERARRQHRTKWGTPGRRADVVLIENKNSGPSLRQFLAKYDVPCWPWNPGRESKTTRFHAISPLVHDGLLFVPESMRPDRKGLVRDWVEPFLEQICAFAGPGSTEHDEFVDCLSQALAYLRDRNLLESVPERRFIDREQQITEDREEAARLRELEQVTTRGNPYA